MQWLGDYKEDDTVYFLWSTNDADGASVTRATDGEVRIYKDNGTSQTTVGVTDTEDFDSLTGVHACTIDLSADAFYATGADYAVVLQGATIDGQTVNAVLAHFSIENRYPSPADIADQNWDELMTGHDGAGSFGDQVGSVLATAQAVWNYGSAIGSALAAALADALLERDVANVEDSADADSLAALLLKNFHAEIDGTTLYLYKTDDSTEFDTYTVTKSSSADPITSVADPT
jgi:hypothetical protein